GQDDRAAAHLHPVGVITNGAERCAKAGRRDPPVLGTVEATAGPTSGDGGLSATPTLRRRGRCGGWRGAVGMAALRTRRGLGGNLSAARGATDQRHGTSGNSGTIQVAWLGSSLVSRILTITLG